MSYHVTIVNYFVIYNSLSYDMLCTIELKFIEFRHILDKMSKVTFHELQISFYAADEILLKM